MFGQLQAAFDPFQPDFHTIQPAGNAGIAFFQSTYAALQLPHIRADQVEFLVHTAEHA